ncbi:MAG: carbohydrate ABC transporter permease [Acutalibacteraceae bacterium]
MKIKKSNYEKRKSRTGYIFLAPWMFATVLLLIYPIIFSLSLSFSEIKNYVTYSLDFIGTENYREAFTVDDSFLPMLLSSITDMLLNTPMIMVFSLLVAVMLDRDIKAKGVFRLIFFLPVLLGTGYIMKQLLAQDVQNDSMELARGLLLPQSVQTYIGPKVTGYVTEFFNRITLVMWKSGVPIVLTLSGLQVISPSLYEASRIDGASEWEIFWKITLPMITPILLLDAVYIIISYAMDDSSLLNYIVDQAFGKTRFEYAAAMGWIYFVVVLLLLGTVFLILRPFTKRLGAGT